MGQQTFLMDPNKIMSIHSSTDGETHKAVYEVL